MEWNQHVLMILLTAVMLVSLLALCYAFTLYRSVRKEDAGNRTMQELSGFIHEGAMAFLKREYRIIIIFIIIVAAVLAVLGMVPSLQGIDGVGVSGAFCFVVGTLCSGAAGFIGSGQCQSGAGRAQQRDAEGIACRVQWRISAGDQRGRFRLVRSGCRVCCICHLV